MSDLSELSASVIDAARARHWLIATAESCTGGMIAAAITDVAGSSDVFDRGFVTYSNAAKVQMLGVRQSTLGALGAVSAETAVEMAEGALVHSHSTIAVSVTGIAGPGGGSEEKPVGLVHMAVAVRYQPTESHVLNFGDIGRSEVRTGTVKAALEALLDRIQADAPPE